jgi:tRNA threonylcarbamoyladenosine biosynthesis protein TsaB
MKMEWQVKKKLPLNRMALILAIETATEVCSVSLALNGLCLAESSIDTGNSHASMLHVLVDKILKETGKTTKDLDAIAVSKGPGSYTGLRVGTSTAKGFCYALNIPLIAINSLKNLSSLALVQTELLPEKALLVPMLDARRLEVYTAVYTQRLETIQKTHALVIDSEAFNNLLENHTLAYFGNGSDKAKQFLTQKGATYIPNIKLSASGLCNLAEKKFHQNAFEELISFEPLYLKDFVGTTPKKRF